MVYGISVWGGPGGGGVTNISFYVNDIIEDASNSSIECFIDFNCVNIICYADDFILLCPSANGLQFFIDKLLLNLSLNSMKLNAN